MSEKEVKSLGLLPRLSTNEKKVFQVLVNNGASTVLDIAQRGKISKGRVPTILDTMIERGIAAKIQDETSQEYRYLAVFPIMRFTEIVSNLIKSLQARNSELEATTEIVNNFTETAIKSVREASTEEREKRTQRSEEDIKDLEIAMDASFSGMLVSIEMDLKDLYKITKAANEFLTETSLRTEETCMNINKQLKPLGTNFSVELSKIQLNAQNQLESSVDARIKDVIDFSTKAGKAFDEVLDAFKDSQEAFEDIIFTILDSGIADLEKVTRPINEQIEEAINSLKNAIQQASNNFQTEMIRVLNEQKRPMITAIDGLRPKTAKVINESNDLLQETLDRQHHSLSGLMENHFTIFGAAAEELAKEFDTKIDLLVEQSIDNISHADSEMKSIEQKYLREIEKISDEKDLQLHNATAKSRDILNDNMNQFIDIANYSVAQYQMELGDSVAKLESEFLTVVENSGTIVQNLINYLNLALTEPVKSLLGNLDKLNSKIDKDEEEFLLNFDQTLNDELKRINFDFKGNSKKSLENLSKDFDRIKERLEKDISSKQDILKNQITVKDKEIQSFFKDFVDKHQKELRNTDKEITALVKKTERWRGDSAKTIQQRIDSKVNTCLDSLTKNTDTLISRISNDENISKNDLIKLIRDSRDEMTKQFKNLGIEASKTVNDSLSDIGNVIKNDSLTMNNRLIQFKLDQDKLIQETKYPVTKLIIDIQNEVKQYYQKVNTDIIRFLSNELDNFNRSREEVDKYLEATLERKGAKTSKDISSLKEVFERARENYVNKTKENFEEIERTIAKDSASLLDQEHNSRENIIKLNDQIIRDLSNSVNSTTAKMRTNLMDGAEKIFGEAISELSKLEIELKDQNEKQRDDSIQIYNEVNDLHRKQLEILDDKIDTLKEKQIGNAYEFRDIYTRSLKQDLTKQLEILRNSKEEITKLRDSVSTNFIQTVDLLINKAIQELETQTSGIEGAIFSTVGNITAEASRKTEQVVVIGEQAVYGIEERYTENLERIRQSLTDEVITRIDTEATKITNYKDNLREIEKMHNLSYGQAMQEINENIKKDITNAEKAAMKTIAACDSLSCKFLKELAEEISANRDRVGFSTDRLIKDLLDDFHRVLQKVKREATLFARKQFELSNKSNYEIAEAFLKSVDDLEEVMLRQIDNFSKRTSMAIERTKEMSVIISEHIQDMISTFDDLREE
ncbi:MAG: helix-turn-helix domain-containing protein [Candidatus Thorarchaeota archaeon]